MSKNILLPTDFSDNAWSAAVYALKLYANEECTFYFLYSSKLKVSRISIHSNKLLEVMRKKYLKELSKLKQMAEATNANANHNFEIILSTQDLQNAIKYNLKKYSIDLVVMGTKGATKAKGLFFGSNTVKTIKKVKHCPILIVPDEFDFVIPKQIAFATNFEQFYEDKELNALKNLAALYDSKISVVSILSKEELNTIQDYNYKMLKEYLSDYENDFHFITNYFKKTIEINNFIDEFDINILAMVHYKHSFIESLINEPIIKKIGFHSIVPFLVIPE